MILKEVQQVLTSKTPTISMGISFYSSQNDTKNNNPLFKEAELSNDMRIGANRALLNWYRIDRSTSVEKHSK